MTEEKNQTLHTFSDLKEEFLEYLASIKGFSPNTVAGYRNDLERLEKSVGGNTGIQSITLAQLRACVSDMSRRKYAPASINRFIASVHRLFAYCKKNHYIEVNMSLELKSVKQPKRLPKFMTQSEIDELCLAPEKNKLLWPVRDKAIFEMLYSSGCRVSELASLKFSDFSEDYGSALIMGKGHKERYVFFEDDARKALRDYLAERDILFPQARKGAGGEVQEVFLNQKGTALTPQGIELIVRRYSGIEGTNNPMTPHAFRHTFATAMLMNGADIREVQAMLGHSSINATQRYTHVTLDRLKEVYDQAFPHSGKQD